MDPHCTECQKLMQEIKDGGELADRNSEHPYTDPQNDKYWKCTHNYFGKRSARRDIIKRPIQTPVNKPNHQSRAT